MSVLSRFEIAVDISVLSKYIMTLRDNNRNVGWKGDYC